MRTPFDPTEAVRWLDGSGTGALRHLQTLPARTARTTDWPSWVDPVVETALCGTGVTQLWSHQRRVADLAHDGHDVVVATGTASGKSLGYQLPVLTAVVEGAMAPTGRGATAIYLSPTKALAGDQYARLHALAVPGLRAAVLDGDTPPDERRWIRDHAQLILTNPDLLHHSLLPAHESWASFLRKLRYVVIDECHRYRGVFGTHVALVLRRLMRVAARYGAEPTLVFASATVADPAAHATALAGRPVQAVTEDGSPRPSTTIALWEPGSVDADGARRSAVAEAADLTTTLVEHGVQTLTFARSRVGVETVAARVRSRLGLALDDQDTVAAYRGGYLPEERRALENGLRSGRVRGLAATNALELGIDISGLDAVVVAGWPGTVASWWQQAGRAGRGDTPSLVVFVAADDPLDTYLVHHPEAMLGRPVDAAVLDPLNRHVLAPHLSAAAYELPLTRDDEQWFGPELTVLADALAEAGILRRRPRGWFWDRDDRPGDHVQLRGGDDPDVRITETRTGRVLGTVDAARAPSTVHPGAVYVHQGQPYVVRDLDLADGSAHAVPGDPGWSTQARSRSEFRILGSDRHTAWGDAQLHVGRLRVVDQVTSFVRRLPSGEVIGEHRLDFEPRTLVTRGVWWTLPEGALAEAGVEEAAWPGALHAAEHAAIGLMSLVAQCDRWDIGGVSTALHPDTGQPTVVVYDGYPGGAGFADRGYAAAQTWLAATAEAIAGCACRSGCPACVQSPKCGNGNQPLDKAGAVAVLRRLLRDA
ncbi:DEAD/DEAH box helicase [Calidifontibacter sp. DB0510]|uniref:DEAD/DEAH box helicase n=1 Tax=Metallococcus carri TaxID=1656884 RepID=A0A967E9N2_9MICO|nr:DEAD/DEAH box helicase [Metallococcus carri]NHN55395.1 DEAD/DEAH box helicase [Metallococcus carri]NOP36472.1 DEAD/DEAH box helicase [Calidifontibacter sp. DB2511S]